MVNWELNTISIPIDPNQNAMAALDFENENTGKTAWDELTRMASDGWELVSVTSITISGYTKQLLYTFKRPKPGTV